MAGKGNKKFRQLSLEEKVDLELAGTENAKKEYRKRKKAGTLSDVIKKGKKINTEQQPEQPPVKKPAISYKTTVGTKSGESITATPEGEITIAGVEKNPKELSDEIKKSTEIAQKLAQIGLNNAETERNKTDALDDYSKYSAQNENADKLPEEIDKQTESIEKKDEGIKAISKAVNGGGAEEPIKQATANEIAAQQDDVLNSYLDDPENPATKAAIDQYNRAYNGQQGVEPAIDKLGLSDYYPGINKPLQVGTSVGAGGGSIPIFVAGGGYIPAGIVDARRRAIRDEAKKRANKQDQIIKMLFPKAATNYQGQINDISMELVNKYGKLTNWHFDKLTDMSLDLAQQFWKDATKMKAFAGRTIRTDKQVNKILELYNKKTTGTYIPDKALKCINDWNTGLSKMREFIKDERKFGKIERCINTYDDMIADAQATAKTMKTDKLPLREISAESLKDPKEAARLLENLKTLEYTSPDNDIFQRAMMEFVDMDRVKEIARTQINYKHYYYEGGKEGKEKLVNEYARYLVNMFGTRKEIVDKVLHKYNPFALEIQKQRAEQSKTFTVLKTIHNNLHKTINSITPFMGIDNATARKNLGETVYNNTGMTVDYGSNGEIRAKTNIPPSIQDNIYSVGIDQFKIQAGDGNWYSYDEYNNYLRNKANVNYGTAVLTEEERNFLRYIKKDTPINVSVNSIDGEYVVVNSDGSFDPVKISDNPDKMNSSSVISTVSYDGSFTYSRPSSGKEKEGGITKSIIEKINMPPLKQDVNLEDPTQLSTYENILKGRINLSASEKQGEATSAGSAIGGTNNGGISNTGNGESSYK